MMRRATERTHACMQAKTRQLVAADQWEIGCTLNFLFCLYIFFSFFIFFGGGGGTGGQVHCMRTNWRLCNHQE